MRDPSRIKPILTELERLWMKQPDTRLGQLIAVLTSYANAKMGTTMQGIFYIEDDALFREIRNQLKEQK